MNRLMLLPLFLFLFSKANAQNGRWMYLWDGKGVTFMADTLKNDIKQLDEYDGHLNVVIIWVKTIQNKSNKKGSFIESAMFRFVVDTTINQVEVIAGALYHNNVPVQSGSSHSLPWQDAIPESGGDVLVNYCRALNNPQLMQRFILNAASHDQKASLGKKKNLN